MTHNELPHAVTGEEQADTSGIMEYGLGYDEIVARQDMAADDPENPQLTRQEAAAWAAHLHIPSPAPINPTHPGPEDHLG